VVKKYGAFYDLHRITKKFSIYVVRTTEASDEFFESQPCISCETSLKKMGFKKIIYSTIGGNIEKKKVEELLTNHYSRAQKVVNENIIKKRKSKSWY
jgi:hypothetical protein